MNLATRIIRNILIGTIVAFISAVIVGMIFQLIGIKGSMLTICTLFMGLGFGMLLQYDDLGKEKALYSNDIDYLKHDEDTYLAVGIYASLIFAAIFYFITIYILPLIIGPALNIGSIFGYDYLYIYIAMTFIVLLMVYAQWKGYI